MFAPAVILRPSDKQMSRLRNGHKVRVQRGIEGEGMNLLVNPSRLNQITRSFDKGKGIMVALSPEEIAANKEIEGEGIFGKKFDKLLKKGGIKKGVFAAAAALKPAVKELIKEGVKQAPPKYQPAAKAAAAMATKYLEDPEKYQSVKGSLELAKTGAAEGGAEFAKQQVGAYRGKKSAPVKGGAMMRGCGISGRGSLLNVGNSLLPPALQSQNASANFNMWTQLPPSLAGMKIGGSGLYM